LGGSRRYRTAAEILLEVEAMSKPDPIVQRTFAERELEHALRLGETVVVHRYESESLQVIVSVQRVKEDELPFKVWKRTRIYAGEGRWSKRVFLLAAFRCFYDMLAFLRALAKNDGWLEESNAKVNETHLAIKLGLEGRR